MNWCSDCQASSKAIETGKDARKVADNFKVVRVNVGNFDANLDIARQYLLAYWALLRFLRIAIFFMYHSQVNYLKLEKLGNYIIFLRHQVKKL